MNFTTVASVADIPVGSFKVISVEGHDILLINVDGQFFAVQNQCPHAGGLLCEAKLEGTTLTCNKHGAQFDVVTGKNLRGAKVAIMHVAVKNLLTYPVKLEGQHIRLGVN